MVALALAVYLFAPPNPTADIRPDATFVAESLIATSLRDRSVGGTPWDLALSRDPDVEFKYEVYAESLAFLAAAYPHLPIGIPEIQPLMQSRRRGLSIGALINFIGWLLGLVGQGIQWVLQFLIAPMGVLSIVLLLSLGAGHQALRQFRVQPSPERQQVVVSTMREIVQIAQSEGKEQAFNEELYASLRQLRVEDAVAKALAEALPSKDSLVTKADIAELKAAFLPNGTTKNSEHEAARS